MTKEDLLGEKLGVLEKELGWEAQVAILELRRNSGHSETGLPAPSEDVIEVGDIYINLRKGDENWMQSYRILKVGEDVFYYEESSTVRPVVGYHGSKGLFLRVEDGIPRSVAISDGFLEGERAVSLS